MQISMNARRTLTSAVKDHATIQTAVIIVLATADTFLMAIHVQVNDAVF